MNDWLCNYRKILLMGAFLTALALRLASLPQAGLAEDEVNKVNAVDSYRQGDFTANADHPMLMKSLALLSRWGADGWNRGPAAWWGWAAVPVETAVRLPNAIFGALTVWALYLVANSFFGWRVGVISAWLWATGVNAIFINRVAKEDTLMVFFILLGIFFHRQMKTAPDQDGRSKTVFHLASAACFGAMLASKYFPHFIGLNFLYFYWHRKIQPAGYPPDAYGGKELLRYFLVLGLVFLLLNPMILSPAVLQYLAHYTGQGTVTHHGYCMMDTLYYNNVDKTPFAGTPWYFYLLYLGVKVPPVVLACAAAGLLYCLRRWRDAGPFLVLFSLVFWLAPYSFVGVKFTRYTLSLMPFVYLAAACGLSCLWDLVEEAFGRSRLGGALPSAAAVLVLGATTVTAVTTLPYPSLYVNAFGGGAARVGYYFPHDDYYDLKLREAIRKAAAMAPAGTAAFAGETPAVFGLYLRRAGRTDVAVANLSDSRGPAGDAPRDVYVFLQPGRRYFENVAYYEALWENQGKRLFEVEVEGKPAIRVCRVTREEYAAIGAGRGTGETAHR